LRTSSSDKDTGNAQYAPDRTNRRRNISLLSRPTGEKPVFLRKGKRKNNLLAKVERSHERWRLSGKGQKKRASPSWHKSKQPYKEVKHTVWNGLSKEGRKKLKPNITGGKVLCGRQTNSLVIHGGETNTRSWGA